MNSQIMPLRYRISSWRQLTKCKSNNSRDLVIHVTDFCNSGRLGGLRISVDHKAYGSLFAYMVKASGSIISEYDERFEITLNQILIQLKRFGFDIEYSPEMHLSSSQLEYLITLKQLGYDKIRVLNVWTIENGVKQFDTKVVAFQADPLGDWLNNAYSPSSLDFVKALDAGTAVNLTSISKTKDYRWDWLVGKVLSIDDVIEDNLDDVTSPDDDVEVVVVPDPEYSNEVYWDDDIE